jgi:hypothetical protein
MLRLRVINPLLHVHRVVDPQFGFQTNNVNVHSDKNGDNKNRDNYKTSDSQKEKDRDAQTKSLYLSQIPQLLDFIVGTVGMNQTVLFVARNLN